MPPRRRPARVTDQEVRRSAAPSSIVRRWRADFAVRLSVGMRGATVRRRAGCNCASACGQRCADSGVRVAACFACGSPRCLGRSLAASGGTEPLRAEGCGFPHSLVASRGVSPLPAEPSRFMWSLAVSSGTEPVRAEPRRLGQSPSLRAKPRRFQRSWAASRGSTPLPAEPSRFGRSPVARCQSPAVQAKALRRPTQPRRRRHSSVASRGACRFRRSPRFRHSPVASGGTLCRCRPSLTASREARLLPGTASPPPHRTSRPSRLTYLPR